MFKNNYLKVAVAVPKVELGKCQKNVQEIVNLARKASDAEIVLFPELAISGYSLSDWHFNNQKKIDEKQALIDLVNESNSQIWIVGGVYEYRNSLFNCAYVIQNKKILGIVPKAYLPRSREFNEPRLFASGKPYLDKLVNVIVNGHKTVFGGCIFYNRQYNVCFGVEICGDVWSVVSPNENLYLHGAQMIFNPSASTYHLGKADKRRSLIKAASLKGSGAYIYTSSGITETASDVVFTGHKLVSVDGNLILDEEDVTFTSTFNYVDIDLDTLRFIRCSSGWHNDFSVTSMPVIEFTLTESDTYYLSNSLDKLPFVPKKDERYEEIVKIITAALYHRLMHIGIEKVVLGISGGLDSTLALLLCYECFNRYHLPLSNILAYTMPGLATGTTSQKIALDLMTVLKVKSHVVPIGDEVRTHFHLIDQDENMKDTTYENTQARYRTLVLMNIANKEKAIVIGTGDMSEIALGWSTFNGDQMSMYNLNSGLPKTTVKALVSYFARKMPQFALVLNDVLNATISPELTSSSQATEDIIGKYEINDFIMYHLLVEGASLERIVFLLEKVFALDNVHATSYYNSFMKRFNANQFKRLAAPEGVKIFNVSLSPHGDFRYPGDMK